MSRTAHKLWFQTLTFSPGFHSGSARADICVSILIPAGQIDGQIDAQTNPWWGGPE